MRSTIAALLLLAALGGGALQADLHLDTPTAMLSSGLPLDAPEGLESGLVQLRAGGTNVPVLVLWPGTGRGDPRARTFRLLDLVEREVARLDGVEIARSASEARRVAGAGGTAVVLALEGAHGLGDGDWRAVLDELDRRGLSVLGLTWSHSNRFAGSSGDGGGGLTKEGRGLVAEARRRGLLLDLSHASAATVMEVCAGSPVPVIASHSDARAVHDHPRNLTDDEVRCIAATGGVVGVNLHRTFLGGAGDLARVVEHVEHLAAVGGRGAVALGTDFDGRIRPPAELPDASALPRLLDALRARGWSEEDLAGFRGENFLRAWARVRP